MPTVHMMSLLVLSLEGICSIIHYMLLDFFSARSLFLSFFNLLTTHFISIKTTQLTFGSITGLSCRLPLMMMTISGMALIKYP